MPNLLDKILAYKREELAARKRKVSVADVRAKAADAEHPRDFLGTLKSSRSNVTDGGYGGRAVSPPVIIAEIKKASPSAGIIRADFNPVGLAQSFEENGAAALSILTDEHFFQGSLSHLESVRARVKIPLLRKDFTFDEYQIFEARGAGADAVLLIVRSLDLHQLRDYAALTGELGMAALVEVHNEEELKKALLVQPRLIGINNRDLETFKTDLQTTIRLKEKIPEGPIVVSESGIQSRKNIEQLVSVGVMNFLIGEALLKSANPSVKLLEFTGS